MSPFRIAEAALSELVPDATRRDFLLAIVLLFDDLFLLAGGSSSTHPDPLARSVHLTRKVFDDEAAARLAASYDDPTLLVGLFCDDTAAVGQST